MIKANSLTLTMAVPMMLVGCAPAADRAARSAISGTVWENCLAKVHWTAITQSGVLTLNPFIGGLGFAPLDRPITRNSDFSDLAFGAIPVENARRSLIPNFSKFVDDYKRAGSPPLPNNDAAAALGFGRIAAAIDKMGNGYVRGTASGWLSKNKNIHCMNDGPGGRIFLISHFTPAFPEPRGTNRSN